MVPLSPKGPKVLSHEDMLPLFAHLRQEVAVADLEAFGNECAPLTMAGKILNLIGKVLAREMRKDSYPRSDCVTQAKAQGLLRHKDGSITVNYREKGSNMMRSIRAARCLLAMGGRQRQWNESIPCAKTKVLTTPYAISDKGILDIQNQLTGIGRSPKIAVIGGSHSAWSSVWVLLNKVIQPADKVLQLKRLRKREELISKGQLDWSSMASGNIEAYVNLAKDELDAECLRLPRWKRSTAASRGNNMRLRKILDLNGNHTNLEKNSFQGEFKESKNYRASWSTGLLVREGVELDSKLIRNIGNGEIFCATARKTNKQGQNRLRVVDGWVSETAGNK